jgi:phosphate transport system substrate-binding protein
MSFRGTAMKMLAAHGQTLHRVIVVAIGTCMLCLGLGASAVVRADAVRVGGTGSGGRLIALLADEFRRTNPDIEVSVVSPPLGSAGGVRALLSGNIDLAIRALPLSAEQRARLGAEFELARTPLVLATQDRRAQGFGLAEVADIYGGRLTKWTNGVAIRVILRSEYEAETGLLRAMSPDIDREVRNALRRKGMVIAENDLDAIGLIERIEGSIGTTTLGLVKTQNRNVTVLTLNGVAPSVTTLASGAYPWFKPLYVVTSKSPSPGTIKFLAFVRSAKARDIIRRAEYLPSLE